MRRLTRAPPALPLRSRVCLSVRCLSTTHHVTKAASTRANPPWADQVLSCQSWRWFSDEATHLDIRRLGFDIEELGRVAAATVGSKECVDIMIIGEGGLNRVFQLTMDDSKKVVARFPFKNAGPASLTIRSEVATMDLIRELGIPVPKVLAWSATSDNSIGSEYIIMELCPGTKLEWVDDPDTQLCADKLLGDYQSALCSLPFSQYGSIFYTEDMSPELQARPLFRDPSPYAWSDRFRIGPSIERNLYRGGRSTLDIDRGPWRTVSEYLNAKADCEISWIQAFSNTPNAKRQLGSYRSPDRHIQRIEQWKTLMPALLPEEPLCAPSLAHPDLHEGNVLVSVPDEGSHGTVTGVIDWQGAVIRPLFDLPVPKQYDLDPSKLIFRGEAVDIGKPSPSEEDTHPLATLVRDEYHTLQRRDAYLQRLQQTCPPAFLATTDPRMKMLRNATYYVSHGYSDGLPLLERTMIELIEQYGSLFPTHADFPTCPISFSAEEIERRKHEFKYDVDLEATVEEQVHRQFIKRGLTLRPDTALPSAEWEEAWELAEKLRVSYSDGLPDAPMKGFNERWPLRPGRYDHMADSCR